MSKAARWVLLMSALFALSMQYYSGLMRERAAKTLTARGLNANLSDLYPYWLGIRYLLIERRDPYSNDATRMIQTALYGRPLDPSRASDPKDEHRFIYPAYVCLALAPIAFLPFGKVEVLFALVLPVVTAVGVWCWWRALRIGGPISWIGAAIVLTLGSFSFAEGYS